MLVWEVNGLSRSAGRSHILAEQLYASGIGSVWNRVLTVTETKARRRPSSGARWHKESVTLFAEFTTAVHNSRMSSSSHGQRETPPVRSNDDDY